MDERIPAPHVARLIGIKTPTLAKWRYLGKGPRGWIERTRKTQHLIMKNHLLRYFGNAELSTITTIRVIDFIADLRARSCSPSYINDCVRVLKMLLRQAVERDVIADYPIKRKEIPTSAARHATRGHFARARSPGRTADERTHAFPHFRQMALSSELTCGSCRRSPR